MDFMIFFCEIPAIKIKDFDSFDIMPLCMTPHLERSESVCVEHTSYVRMLNTLMRRIYRGVFQA